MKINSISFKLATISVLMSALLVAGLIAINAQDQEFYFKETLEERSKTIARTIDAFLNIKTFLDYGDQEKTIDALNDFILNSSQLIDQTNIESITINLVTDPQGDELGELYVVASTDSKLIGNFSNYHLKSAYSYLKGTMLIEKLGDEFNYLVIMPIEVLAKNGEYYRIGTYELIVSMEKEINAFEEKTQNTLKIYFMVLICFIVAIYIILHYLFVKPILLLSDLAKDIGKGKLDVKVEIKYKDEIGDLANAFNKMANKLKESRIKIEDYNKILERLIEQKDEFIGQLGHDLKNPLQPLVGLLPILIEQEKNPETKETLQVMNKNVEYMSNLISNTLQLAKLRSSNIKFDMEDINLKEEVDDIIVSQSLIIQDNKIVIENTIDKDIVVQADKLRLVEVFKNLITNSIKYTPDTGGKLIIDAKKEKDIVTVSIKDTGIGMTKDQIKKIFDEFYKADRFSSEEKSSGLGLAICKRIIERHGGCIWVDSLGLGKGSTFYFTLKLGEGK